MSILLALFIDCPAFLRFCTLAAFLRGPDCGIPEADAAAAVLSAALIGTDFTI